MDTMGTDWISAIGSQGNGDDDDDDRVKDSKSATEVHASLRKMMVLPPKAVSNTGDENKKASSDCGSRLQHDVVHGLWTIVHLIPTFVCIGVCVVVTQALGWYVVGKKLQQKNPTLSVLILFGIFSLSFYLAFFVSLHMSRTNLAVKSLATVFGCATVVAISALAIQSILNWDILWYSTVCVSFATWLGCWLTLLTMLKSASVKGHVVLFSCVICLGTTINILALAASLVGILSLPEWDWEISVLYPLVVVFSGRLVVVELGGFMLSRWFGCDQVIVTKNLILFTRAFNYMLNNTYVLLLPEWSSFLVSLFANTVLEVGATWLSLKMNFNIAHFEVVNTLRKSQVAPISSQTGSAFMSNESVDKSKARSRRMTLLGIWIADKRKRLEVDAIGFNTYLHYCDDIAEKVNCFASTFNAVLVNTMEGEELLVGHIAFRIALFWVIQFMADLVKAQVRFRFDVIIANVFPPRTATLKESLFAGLTVMTVFSLNFIFRIATSSQLL